MCVLLAPQLNTKQMCWAFRSDRPNYSCYKEDCYTLFVIVTLYSSSLPVYSLEIQKRLHLHQQSFINCQQHLGGAGGTGEVKCHSAVVGHSKHSHHSLSKSSCYFQTVSACFFFHYFAFPLLSLWHGLIPTW